MQQCHPLDKQMTESMLNCSLIWNNYATSMRPCHPLNRIPGFQIARRVCMQFWLILCAYFHRILEIEWFAFHSRGYGLQYPKHIR